jgi:hypothetical protein
VTLRSRAALLAALALSMTACAVIGTAAQRAARADVVAHAAGEPNWRAAQADLPSYPQCLRKPIAACVVVRGHGPRVLLMGDSLARMWLPAFREIARRNSLTLAAAIYPACPWPENLDGLGISPECPTFRADWYRRLIPQFHADIVVLANRPYDAPGNVLPIVVFGHHVTAATPLGVRAVTAATKRSIHTLRRPGRKLVLLEPTPLPPKKNYDPISCLAAGTGPCGFTVSTAVTPLTRLDRKLGTARDTWSIDLDHLVCPRFPTCDAVLYGKVVRRDHTHLTATFARAVSFRLQGILERQHVLARRP